jgi:hypothetical protein
VEKAIQSDIEARNLYKAIGGSEREARRLYFQELRHLNIQETPPLLFNRRKTAGVIIVIVAVLLCAIFPAILYIKNSGSNKNKMADNSSETEIEITEDFIENSNKDNIAAAVSDTKIEITEDFMKKQNKDNIAIAVSDTKIETAADFIEDNAEIEGAVNTSGGYSPEYMVEVLALSSPSSITSIENSMFWFKGLSTVTIPDRITSIWNDAFSDNPIVSVIISSNVTVADNAFPDNFTKVYERYGKTAGTYTRPSTDSEEWEKSNKEAGN